MMAMYALDAATGSLRWKYHTEFEVYFSPAISGDVVYVGSLDGNVYAFGHRPVPAIVINQQLN